MALVSARPLSKYRKIAQRLRAGIVGGKLQPGDRFPSFPQMLREGGATQKTVEQAYALLDGSTKSAPAVPLC